MADLKVPMTTNLDPVVEAVRKAHAFIARNLTDLADEVLHWKNTGRIAEFPGSPEPRIRVLAKMLEPVSKEQALALAENMVNSAALQKVASGG